MRENDERRVELVDDLPQRICVAIRRVGLERGGVDDNHVRDACRRQFGGDRPGARADHRNRDGRIAKLLCGRHGFPRRAVELPVTLFGYD